MKLLLIFVTIFFMCWGCKKADTSTNNEFMSGNSTGTAVIEGRIGYYSPSLPPPESNNTFIPYPSGYQLGEYHWINDDTPKVVSRIYLNGDYGQFKFQTVQIKGTWKEIIRTHNNNEYRYLLLFVDSLRNIK